MENARYEEDLPRKTGTGGLTEYENGKEADGSIYHGMET